MRKNFGANSYLFSQPVNVSRRKNVRFVPETVECISGKIYNIPIGRQGETFSYNKDEREIL